MIPPDFSIAVITAATGHPGLLRCIQSVQEQIFPNIQHWLVIDGPEHKVKVSSLVESLPPTQKPMTVMQLPEPTGKDGWVCHRIYGALPYLVNTQWVCYLDEDNWFDPDHLQSLVEAIIAANAHWAHSLRRIVDAEGNFICLDQCESLGTLHPVYLNDEVRLVDTNCYLLRRDIAIRFCTIWNRKPRNAQLLPPDFALCMAMMQTKVPSATNRRHTLNYTAGSTSESVDGEFFLKGNAKMHERYPDGLPWELPTLKEQ